MRKNILLLISLFGSFVLFAQTETNLHKHANKAEMNRWVDSVYNAMTPDERVGQLFMPIVESNSSWKQRIANYIDKQKIGGVLFSKGTLTVQAEMTNYLQSISKTPLFVALDGEWGLSMRLTDAPKYPRNQIIGAIDDDETLYQYGKEIARQCREMGIHINFAPSVDVHSNPNNPVIGTRSFGEHPESVARQGVAFGKGMEENGVMAVAKHFPGHGDTSDDSHHTLPTITHNIDRLEKVELLPFKTFIDAGLSGVMTGHLDVKALKTNGIPSSLSSEIGIKLLKEEMGFTGLTFTDGLAMKGVSTQPDMSIKALLAGNDILVGAINIEKEFNSVKQAAEKGVLSEELIEDKVKRILSYKYILNVHNQKPIRTATLHQRVNAPESEWTLQKIYDKAVSLVQNKDSVIPIMGLDKKRIASVAIGAPGNNIFQKWLSRYTKVDIFQTQIASIGETAKKLADYELVIFSIHDSKMKENPALQEAIRQSKSSVLVLFDSPYSLNGIKNSTNLAKAVVVGYDNSKSAQISVAQALFGGIEFSGKLSVSTDNYKARTGIETPKIRLSYALPEEVGIASEKLAHIENIAIEGLRQRAYPGCYVMVAKDGVVIYDRNFGHLDYSGKDIVNSETVYDLASVTKVAATVPALMKLYDEKKIRLQDTFGKYIPEAAKTNKAGITIREALFHETGIVSFIPYYTSAIDIDSYTGSLFGRQSSTYHAKYAGAWGRTDYRFMPTLISDKPSDTYSHPVAKGLFASDKMHDVLLNDVINTKLNAKRYRYSCLNFMLLKEAIDNITKTDLNSYLQDNLYKKLGSTSTTFQPLKYMSESVIAPTENDPFFRKQQIRGYVHDEGAALFGGISGNAGLFSNANDLAKIFQMWLNGGEYGGERFLSAETVNLFTKTKSGRSRRGLGFDKPEPGNTKLSPTSPLTPPSVYGHTGFTGTSFWVDPDNNMIYIFLSNRIFPSRTPNRMSSLKIRERIQDELYKAIWISENI